MAPYGAVIIKLLKDAIYHDRDKDGWEKLLLYRTTIEEYFEKIGVNLYLNETDGFAYLFQNRSSEDDGEVDDKAPKLTRAMPLSYDVTLLCVLLRERLYQFDTNEGESSQIVITLDEIRELLAPYFKERLNEEKQLKKFDSIINQVKEFGFIRELKGHEPVTYKIERIIKARVPADKLQEIKERLKEGCDDRG